MAPLLVVPTELTDNTEAYGLIFLESTERIDAARHTTESTETIACVAEGGESCNHFWILASQSVGHSVDSKSLTPSASVSSVSSVGPTKTKHPMNQN